MFAIFLHESMNPFHQTVTSFPTAIFTVMLALSMMYWIVAVLGFVDLEVIDVDLDGDIDMADSDAAQAGIAGILFKLGLNGVPLVVIISLISIIGWFTCLGISLYFYNYVPDFWLADAAFRLILFIGATMLSIFATAQIIKPLRILFKKLDVDETKHIIGQKVTVRSSSVDSVRGEAELNDGGAGILLNVRATGTDSFKKGDEVIVIEQIENTNLYRVIHPSEFTG